METSLVDIKYFNTIPAEIVIIRKSDNYEIIYANDEFLNKYGFSRSDVISKSFISFITDKKKFNQQLLSNQFIDSYKFLSNSMGIIDLSITSTSIQIDDTECYQLSINCHQKDCGLLNKERENFNRLKDALNEASIVAITDEKGIIIEVNDHFCKLSGYSRDELLGNTHQLINSSYHPKEFFKEMWQQIKKGNVWKGDIRNVTKNGDFYWVSTTIVPLPDEEGNPSQFISIRHDITRQKETEEQLKYNEKYLENFISSLGDIVLEVDEHLNFTNAIVSSEDDLFFPKEEFLSKSIFSVFEEERATYIASLIKEVIRSGVHKEMIYEDWVNNSNTWYRADINLIIDEGDSKRVSIIIRDITETMLAKKALQQSEDKYHRLLSQLDAMVYIRNSNDLYDNIFVSDRSSLITGYSKESFLNDEIRLYDLVHIEDAQRVKNTILKAIENRENYNVQYRIQNKERGWIHVLEKGCGVWSNDQLEHHEGIIIDINDAILFEQKLAEKDKLYRLISENSADWVSLHNSDKRWVYNSPSVESVTGYTSEELIIDTPENFIHPDDFIDIYRKAFVRLRATNEEQVVEYRFRHKDGTYLWFESTLSPIFENNELIHIESITRNVNQRRRAEDQLKNAERLTNIGSWELDLVRDKLFWSDETHRIFELPIIPEVVSYENFLKVVHPEDRELLDATYKRSVENKTSYELIHRLLFDDGRIKYVHERGSTTYDVDGTPLRSIGSVQDITQMHLTKLALLDLNDRLEEKVRERTDDLLLEIANRERIEKEKLTNETNYKVLFDNIPAGIAILEALPDGSDFVFVDLNQIALKYSEKSEVELIGKCIGEVFPPIKLNETRLFKAVKHVNLTGETVHMSQYNFHLINEKKWLEVFVHKLPSEQIVCVLVDVSDVVTMQYELKNSVKEKEILLDEIHHRVKNNLQVIIGLISLQQKNITDSQIKSTLLESERRIRAMALIHEIIYGSKNYSYVEMEKYLTNLLSYLSESFKDMGVEFYLEVEDCNLSISTATNIGIILTEILTNCFKYAFNNIQSPEIKIKLEPREKGYSLCVCDNGNGFNKEINLEEATTLGMNLIYGMVKQLKGDITLDSGANGTKYYITFYDTKKS